MKSRSFRIESQGLHTLSNGSRCDESTLHHDAGSLLSREAGDGGALHWLVEWFQKLRISHTEARSVCESIMTDVVVPIGWVEVLVEVAVLHFASAAAKSPCHVTKTCSLRWLTS